MNKPTDEQLDTALDAARRMQLFGVDPHHLARSLLYLSESHQDLWEVVQQVDRYIRLGLTEAERVRLEKGIQRLREGPSEPVPESEFPNSVML